MPRSSTRGRRPAASRVKPPPQKDIAVTVSARRLLPAADGRWLKGVIHRAVVAIGRTSADISVLLLDDDGIADLHDRWLGVPGPTDVITFDLASPGDPGLHGDLAISVETARRMARQVGWAFRHELAYYAAHGLLHLAGEDDHTAADRRRMRAREREVLVAAGLPPPPSRRPGSSRGSA